MRKILAALLLVWCHGVAAEVAVPVVEDLRQEAVIAQQRSLPLLIMFSAENCGYCAQMEAQFLKPMLISGDYDDKVLIRRVSIDTGVSLRDFHGRRTSTREFADRYKAFVTPTLVFLDPAGRELVDKMVGLTTPEFFGGYLDESIDRALDRMRGSACTPPC